MSGYLRLVQVVMLMQVNSGFYTLDQVMSIYVSLAHVSLGFFRFCQDMSG